MLNDSVSTELPAGSPRRWEPVGGIKKHNEFIHKDSTLSDKKNNLPFKFYKPKKPKKPAVVICNNCNFILNCNEYTVGVICPSCKQYSSVRKVFDNE